MSLFSGRESREFVRVSASFDVRIKVGEADLGLVGAFAHDLSTGGLGLVLSEQEEEAFQKLKGLGEPVEVEFDLPGGRPMRLRAKVTWAHRETRDPERHYRIGLRFLEADAQRNEALSSFVKAKAFEYAFPPRK